MRYVDMPGPLAIAHRGGGELAGENTREAFALSVGLGYRLLESDVRVSADGEAILFHDATLDRATDGTGPVRAHPLRDLRRLTVRPPAAGAPTGTMCTLDEALGDFPDVAFSLDLKDLAATEPLVRTVRRHRAAERVCIAGAWDGWLAAVRAELPGVTTSLGWRSLTALLTCVRLGARPPRPPAGAGFAHVPMVLGGVPVYADAVVHAAHDLGVRVVTWTVNDPRVMDALLDAGVDAVITDRPDVLREVLVRRGDWLPLTRGPRAASPACAGRSPRRGKMGAGLH